MTNPEDILDVQEWYTPEVPRKVLKVLMKRTNRHAAFYFALWAVLLGASGYLAARLFLSDSLWAIPAFFFYGVVFTGANPRWHETSHGTPFKARWINEFFYFFCGAMEFRDMTDFRWSHTRHHSYTIMRGVDPEIAAPRPPRFIWLILDFFYLHMGFIAIKNLILHSLGIVSKDVRAYVPDDELKKMFWRARGVLALHAVPIFLSIYLGSWLPVLLFTFPRFYGAFFMWVFIACQHIGMAENIWDHRYSTRSLKVNFFFSFLFMNMESHVEHHMYPLVPFHALPKLREKLKDQLPPPYKGMWRAIREMIPVLINQRKDPSLSVKRPIPAE